MSSDNNEELKLELERLKAENDALKKTKSSQITFKVGKKGGMSLYGLGRFPVTLYKSQWIMLLDASEKITEFLINHDDELK
jgi:hypothetical protein